MNTIVTGPSTKVRIIEAAGRLFSEYGYADTTSRQICKAARTNITGVNYHFGSREGLYAVVLMEVHDYIINNDFLVKLAGSDLPARRKLETFIDSITSFDGNSWQLRLWAREVVSPSPMWISIVDESIKPDLLLGMLSDLTGIPVGEAELNYCLICLMSPIMVMLVVNHREQESSLPIIRFSPKSLARYTKAYFFAGAERVAEEYRAKKTTPMKSTA